MTAEQKNIPVLRFPQYRDMWQEKEIKEITNYVDYRGKTPTKTDSGIFLVTAKNIKQGYIDYECSQEYISKEDYEDVMRRGKPLIGDVLITTEAPLGNIATIDREDIALAQRVIKLRGKKRLLYNLFLKQRLISPQFQKALDQKASGTTAKGIKGSELHKIPISFPTISEQQKIADFLTEVDDKIQQLSKKKKLLGQYRKSMTQKLFSRELRFKDDKGKDFPEWEESQLGEVYTFFFTNSFSRSLLNYDRGEVKNIHYGDIHTKFKSRFYLGNENVPFINPDIDLTNVKSESYCQVKDLVIADASEDYKDIGKSIEIIDLNNETLLAGLHTYIARDVNNKMALGFGGYLMQTDYVRKQIMKLATGISVLGISKGNLSTIEISLPSKPEQQKIADCLTNIDDKINEVQTQIEQTQQYKKGLLQQMFI